MAQYIAFHERARNTEKAKRIFHKALMDPLVAFVNDYSRFPIYEVDFGFGVPFWFGM